MPDLDHESDSESKTGEVKVVAIGVDTNTTQVTAAIPVSTRVEEFELKEKEAAKESKREEEEMRRAEEAQEAAAKRTKEEIGGERFRNSVGTILDDFPRFGKDVHNFYG